jgi:hypothetical protein
MLRIWAKKKFYGMYERYVTKLKNNYEKMKHEKRWDINYFRERSTGRYTSIIKGLQENISELDK